MPALEKDLSRFEALNTQVLGISVDSLPANKAFAEKLGVKSFPLLSDLKKEVAQKYGVLRQEGFSERCTFLIDKQGIIRWKQVQAKTSDQRNNDDLIAAIKGAVAG